MGGERAWQNARPALPLVQIWRGNTRFFQMQKNALPKFGRDY